ncbi:TIR domain-containing protein [Frankia sp. ACN10a]|uniref:nSTAND1 domain-containing NTPase n=1 Tax=Frankia sp. ACN10a TaxID=2926031 RepID=UPI002119A3BF|nr:TIR domain-containing protein [Frankia sp. ACN10a]
MTVARVFVSHASSDVELADRIYRTLADLGHRAFLARDIRTGIRPGEVWKERLHQELRAADAVICVVTEAYNTSPWCAYEIGIAHEVGSLLLPLRAQAGVASPLLDDRQHVAVVDNGGWIGDLDGPLRRVGAAGGLGWAWDRSPFPGLRPFTRDMARVFYGRADELRRLAHRLRALSDRRLLLVVGGSGCGKSSLVTAGLTARLGAEPGWEIADPFLPGRDPTRKLALALAQTAIRVGLRWEPGEIHQRLVADDRALVGLAEELLSAGYGQPRDRLLLVVDQGEELFTRADAAERARFAGVLSRGLDGPIRVVIAVRSEFQDQLFALPELHGAHLHTFPLRPLARDMLSVVITEPARVAGLSVEPELVSQMVADTDGGEALPLLAFTLHELARNQTRGGRLSAQRYEELGGVRGALARRADAVLDEAVAAARLPRAEILAGMAELATLDEGGRRTRRRIEVAELPSEAMRTAFGVFVEQRLLSTASDSLGGAGVGVVHEALLSVWPPLDAAIREREAALLSEGQVERAAAAWAHGGPLWDVDRLTAATTILWGSYDRFRAGGRAVVNLNNAGQRFLAECHCRVEAARHRERRRRRRTIAVLAALLAVTLAGAATAGWQGVSARQAQHSAERAQRAVIAQALLTRADDVSATDRIRALRLSLAAWAVHPDAASQERLQTLASSRTALANGSPVTAVAFSRDGKLLATGGADASVLLWSVAAGPDQPRRVGLPLTGLRSQVTAVTFSADGRQLVATGFDRTRMAWDIGDSARPRPVDPVAPALGPVDTCVDRSPAAPVEAVGEELGGVSLWSAGGGAGNRRLLGWLPAGPGEARAVRFSPDGSILAVGSGRGVRLWDARTAARLPPATADAADLIGRPALDACASETEKDEVRRDREGRESREGRSGPAGDGADTSARDARDARDAQDSRNARDSLDPPAPSLRPIGQPLTGHTHAVFSLAFSQDGSVLASGGNDGMLRLWRVSTVNASRRQVVAAACAEAGGGLDASSWQFYLPGVPYRPTCER